jgi:hypothetical protein
LLSLALSLLGFFVVSAQKLGRVSGSMLIYFLGWRGSLGLSLLMGRRRPVVLLRFVFLSM